MYILGWEKGGGGTEGGRKIKREKGRKGRWFEELVFFGYGLYVVNIRTGINTGLRRLETC